MYMVREVYNGKPGCAPALIEGMKAIDGFYVSMGWAKSKIYADFVGRMNTIVIETEVENLDDYFKLERSMYEKPPEERDPQLQGLVDQFNNNTVVSYREIWEVLQ